jgi:hypothetical protein
MVMGWQRQWIVSLVPRGGCFEKQNAHFSSKDQAFFFLEKHLALFFLFTSVVGIKGRNYIYIIFSFLFFIKFPLAPSWVGAYLGNTMLLGHYPNWCGEY